jgi:hypothetical protein
VELDYQADDDGHDDPQTPLSAVRINALEAHAASHADGGGASSCHHDHPRITLPRVMPGWCTERPGAATSLVLTLPPGSNYERSMRTLRGGATMNILWWILVAIAAIVWIAIAFWPARVAGRKGHSFIGFFIFSLFFFPAAIITAYLVPDRSYVPPRAAVVH